MKQFFSYHLSASLLRIILCSFIFTLPSPVHAVACNFYQGMSSTTKDISSWTTPCVIATTDGIDLTPLDTSTTNAASLTLGDGGAITINNTGILALGTLHLGLGSISILTGGIIQPGTPLYVTDTDGDGWPDDFTFYNATSSGRRRLSLMRNYGTVDCDPSSFSMTNTCCTIATRYRDNDGDGYGNPNISISACPTAGYVDNNTDCGDANANAKPGSATCSSASFTNNNGQASWDWNCSQNGLANGGTVCGTDLAYGTTGSQVGSGQGIGSCKNNNAGCRNVTNTVYPVATIACGTMGAVCTQAGLVGTHCGSCGTTTGGSSACIAISAATAQTCQ